MAGEEDLRRRLAELVAFDTQNPTGDEGPLAAKLAQDLRELSATHVETFAVGSHHAAFATFGSAPRLLLNAHIDTVPANPGYSSRPHQLVERGDRLVGLGAADTKGAIAAILEALAARSHRSLAGDGFAVLFSGDEEATGSVAHAFLASDRARGLERAIVCEPTGCRVGVRHRGIGAARAKASSVGGHSSLADDMAAPVVVAARGAVALDRWARRNRDKGPPGFEGLCVNVAAIDGGVAFNVVPTRAVLTVSYRPWPGADIGAVHREAESEVRTAAEPDPIEWEVILANPPFATRDVGAFARWLGDAVYAPIDLHFWTEAALFSAAGIDAVVFGPGEIAQAHAPDESVEIQQLLEARDVFARALG
jgi:acetylornithine deacetylase